MLLSVDSPFLNPLCAAFNGYCFSISCCILFSRIFSRTLVTRLKTAINLTAPTFGCYVLGSLDRGTVFDSAMYFGTSPFLSHLLYAADSFMLSVY